MVEGILPENYISEIRLRKNRYIGNWFGTAGSLAGDCHWLLEERQFLLKEIQRMGELQDANDRLRRAVEERLAAGGAASAACCEGGRCHPQSVDTAGPAQDVDQVIADDDDRTPESPFLSSSGMGASQMEQAWAAVKARHAEMHARIKQPASPDPHGAQSKAERLLLEAAATVRDRRAKYGPPLEHFQRTVGAINAIFAHKLREPLTPEDWAQFMSLDKMARHQEQSQRDNPLDVCGYSACWAEVMGQE